jgi:ABC-type transporter Mla subunit MlaD
MESEARYTLVGATIIALVVAGIAAIFWLKGAGTRDEARLYTIYFQRQSLDGLQVGADVTMLGVSVGKVVDYAIDPRATGSRSRCASGSARRSARRPRRSCSATC